MRAAIAEQAGRLADVVRVREIEEPTPGPGEVTVRMLATTVNPSDAVTVSGAYGSRTRFPLVPGFEGVGVVECAGAGVPPDEVGRRVLPLGSAGNWQQLRTVDAGWCVGVPDDIDDETACFAYINPLTAFLMVERFASEARTAVVTAATSTIAGHLAELLSRQGIAPTGVVRVSSASRVADPPLWRSVIRDGDPLPAADVVFDCVGGRLAPDLVEALTPGGVLVHYGLLSGAPLPAACFSGRRGTRVEMFRLRDTVHSGSRGDLAALMDPVFGHLRAGRLRTAVSDRVRLTDLPTALAEQVGSTAPRSERSGKLLIDPQA
ncbi:zinc-dependent alcohol dehydrogenase family protein [Tsukamurella sp. 8F]|uniref:zinc-dependent alcohol dehydrogenase family protein n=1 Tax=unclassified Tsukamurella TaxID=2633480 RepID=UPI0023B94605|nr:MULTISPECIES: zinc-dependent alcohol dehydrogenase family protein [unclassified Tsukamurella]MDF0528805.1 zinc-dependent alcohol dehydrogenase family protein [Tsukamurella sp. 8J]MDF0586640.1 zinc-dependent alcohol dehydrogenase family protein [Tsukamurella sp. 8F]